MAATAVLITTWQGCYADGWQDLIVSDAFSHPAKYARGLIHRLYRHLIEQGYVRQGETVLDPFGGVALGALDAMTYGLRYVGVELEPRFVALGAQNLDLWRQHYGFTGGTLLQGDSRQLRAVLAGAQVGCVVGSPPFLFTDGGNRPASDPHGMINDALRRRQGATSSGGYGTTPGQLGAMVPGRMACVSSPPYEGCLHLNESVEADIARLARKGVPMTGGATSRTLLPNQQANQGYGTSSAQLGNAAGDTFWSASAQIMTELAALLPSGAVCAWVLKAYVKDKQIVPFPDQWRALCEAHGFTLCEEIHASLVEHHGTQEGLFDGAQAVTTEKKSFFRRLAEKKGSPRIDHETVLIVERS